MSKQEREKRESERKRKREKRKELEKRTKERQGDREREMNRYTLQPFAARIAGSVDHLSAAHFAALCTTQHAEGCLGLIRACMSVCETGTCTCSEAETAVTSNAVSLIGLHTWPTIGASHVLGRPTRSHHPQASAS